MSEISELTYIVRFDATKVAAKLLGSMPAITDGIIPNPDGTYDIHFVKTLPGDKAWALSNEFYTYHLFTNSTYSIERVENVHIVNKDQSTHV